MWSLPRRQNPPVLPCPSTQTGGFLKADAPGAEQPQFDDSAWRKLDVPHDWSIEGPFAETNKTGGAGGFLPSGIGWYRKDFTLPDAFSNRCVFVEFDGVMAEQRGLDQWRVAPETALRLCEFWLRTHRPPQLWRGPDERSGRPRRHLGTAGFALVLRRGHLPPRPAGCDGSGSHRALGHLRFDAANRPKGGDRPRANRRDK